MCCNTLAFYTTVSNSVLYHRGVRHYRLRLFLPVHTPRHLYAPLLFRLGFLLAFSTPLSSSVLYQRGVYHPDGFIREAKYGITTLVTNDDGLKSYLENFIKQLKGMYVGVGGGGGVDPIDGGGWLVVAAMLIVLMCCNVCCRCCCC